MSAKPPGPPDPPIVPGHLGAPPREQLDAMAATLSIFHWLEANGLMRGEVSRLHAAFMFEYGVDAEWWLDQANPPPSWEQITQLLVENRGLIGLHETLRKQVEVAQQALDPEQGIVREDTARERLDVMAALLESRESVPA